MQLFTRTHEKPDRSRRPVRFIFIGDANLNMKAGQHTVNEKRGISSAFDSKQRSFMILEKQVVEKKTCITGAAF